MVSSLLPPLHGPIEDLSWAQTLQAHVFTTGSRPRMHGYDVFGDLAQHYRASDLMLTAFVTNAPTPEQCELFDAALAFLSPVSAAEAPSHSAILSRSCGAAASAVVSVGVTVLAEQCESLLRAHAPLLQWLDAPHDPFPPAFICPTNTERERVSLFIERLTRSSIELPILTHDPTLTATLLAALHRCGLTDPDRLLGVLVLARFPGMLAEGLAAPRGDRRHYPINLPPFQYRDDNLDPSPDSPED